MNGEQIELAGHTEACGYTSTRSSVLLPCDTQYCALCGLRAYECRMYAGGHDIFRFFCDRCRGEVMTAGLPTACTVCGSIFRPFTLCPTCRAIVCDSAEWPATAGSPREPSCQDAHDQQCARNTAAEDAEDAADAGNVGCVECNLLGWCLIEEQDSSARHVERCDTCQTFKDDDQAIDAALASGYQPLTCAECGVGVECVACGECHRCVAAEERVECTYGS